MKRPLLEKASLEELKDVFRAWSFVISLRDACFLQTLENNCSESIYCSLALHNVCTVVDGESETLLHKFIKEVLLQDNLQTF